ncbi:MAG: acyl-CoA reductase [Flavobacteriaceae bacterium]|nr:acyl-CoA reductase [Flavobacteriaceae bacterium]
MSYKDALISDLVQLGHYFQRFSEENPSLISSIEQQFYESMYKASYKNPWFDRDNIAFALKTWSALLTEDKLNKWLSTYRLPTKKTDKCVAVISAGNIPLVGFHDLLCVLACGHHALLKPSSNDTLSKSVIDLLVHINPNLKNRIQITDGPLKNFQAIIATGSDNTARYFEYYFGNKPHVFRKNRNSVAVIDSNTDDAALERLGEDIFRYYGLGCRSISSLFLPKGFNLDRIFKAIFKWRHVVQHHKYANNYDYYKATYLVSNLPILENGFVLFREEPSFASPIAVVHYSYYQSSDEVFKYIEEHRESLQCIAVDDCNKSILDALNPLLVNFGNTQQPQLDDYADHIDTVDYLLKI